MKMSFVVHGIGGGKGTTSCRSFLRRARVQFVRTHCSSDSCMHSPEGDSSRNRPKQHGEKKQEEGAWRMERRSSFIFISIECRTDYYHTWLSMTVSLASAALFPSLVE